MQSPTPLDWHYLGPPDANRRSPYWPAGTPWNLRENFEQFATLLNPESLKAAAKSSPYKAIPQDLQTATFCPLYDVLQIFNLFCSKHGIPRCENPRPKTNTPPRARYLASLPAIHRHHPALEALRGNQSPRGASQPQILAALEAWKNLPASTTAAAWDTYELDALAYALTLPDSQHLKALTAACAGAPKPHPSALLP